MRLTLVHQFVVVALLGAGQLLSHWLFHPVAHGRVERALLGITLGLTFVLAFAGPLFRWSNLWPLIPRCPRCGDWIAGFYRAAHPQGVLLVSAACGHAFRMEGDWIVPILSGSSRIARSATVEMGWMVREDGRAFRFKTNYTAILLDADGEAIGRRRAKWPYWLVRWTDA